MLNFVNEIPCDTLLPIPKCNRSDKYSLQGGISVYLYYLYRYNMGHKYLPARASEQGNVIGSVRIYMCVQKKIVIERTRDLIYLKFVATDFFPKIISPSAGENSGDLA